MHITQKNDPLQNKLIMDHAKLVDIHTTVNHLDPHVRKQRKVRDALTGADVAGLFDYTGSGVKNKLVDELYDACLQDKRITRNDIDNWQFADVYDAVRERELISNNGKSQNNSFWQAAWGVYAEAMANIAKIKGQQKTLFGQLFGA